MSAITLRVGAEVQWQGSEWKLLAFREQGLLTMRSALGEQAAIDLVGLVGDPTEVVPFAVELGGDDPVISERLRA